MFLSAELHRQTDRQTETETERRKERQREGKRDREIKIGSVFFACELAKMLKLL